MVEPEPGSVGVYFSRPWAWRAAGAPALIVLGEGRWPSSDLRGGRVEGGSGFRQGPPAPWDFPAARDGGVSNMLRVGGGGAAGWEGGPSG